MTSDAGRATECLRIDPADPDPVVIARASAILRAGGLVAFPTETVYGLGADATNPVAVRAIFAAKERDRDDPLIVHIADRSDLATVTTEVPPLAEALADAFWPGPLTLVLARAERIAPEVSAGRGTVAVRMPSHAVAVALIRAAGVPIAAPSANRFMRTSATTAAHVLEDLDGRIDLVLDGGPADAGVESTVVAFEGRDIRLLRPGAVTREALEAVAATHGARVTTVPGAQAAVQSPGMLSKHYAPRTPLLYVVDDTSGQALERELGGALAAGQRVGVLATDEALERAGPLPEQIVVERLGSGRDSAVVAHRLFAALRALDAAGVDVIIAIQPPLEGLGAAIHDRLTRAASRVVRS